MTLAHLIYPYYAFALNLGQSGPVILRPIEVSVLLSQTCIVERPRRGESCSHSLGGTLEPCHADRAETACLFGNN